MQLLIKGGRVIDPASGKDAVEDVLLEGGRVTAVGRGLSGGVGIQEIDATDLIVAPGFIDPHVHLREPGQEHKETIATGLAAAAKGGFTAVTAMPNTSPVADNPAVLAFVLQKAAACPVQLYPVAAVTKGLKGEELAELGGLAEAGAVAFSDDGHPVMSAVLMRRALEYAGMFNRPVISHCEDLSLSAGGAMHEGYWSTMLGLPGIPASAEEVMVARDIILAMVTGGRLHLAHVSTRRSAEMVREAKRRGISLTAEVTPHHLALTDASVQGYDTNTKVNPPLRCEEDRQALIEALVDGTIDAVASDHAPHAREEKDVEYAAAPFGLIGLETAVAVVASLVLEGRLGWPDLVARFTTGPARVLNLPPPAIATGQPGNLTLIDPELTLTVNEGEFESLGRNCPFSGLTFTGWPVATIVGGRPVMLNRELVAGAWHD